MPRWLLPLALVSSPLLAHAQRPPTAWPEFVRAFDTYTASDSIVGGAVLLVRGGRVTARHDYGWGDRAAGQRADTNSIYHWASITKTLTAIAVLQLRDRGRLSLDDPVTRWIPELRQVHDPFGSMDGVTVGMLLSHSSGLQAPTWPWTRGEPWEPFEPTRWEQLVAMMPYQRLLFAPGSRYGYSNPGFIYLARIIEAVTGDPWDRYVQKNVLSPLGLTRSYVGVTPYHLAAFRSNNYYVGKDSAGRVSVQANGRDFDPGITIPNGGWNAPLGDLATYLAFLTGAVPNETVLKRTTLNEMWRSRFLAEEPADSMGLSFFVLWRSGTRFVGHTGHQAGFRSFFYLNPATGAAVVAAFNTANYADNEASERGFQAIRDSALALIAR